MINLLLRKFRSAIHLLQGENLETSFKDKLLENYRELNVFLHKNPFPYTNPLGWQFVCIPSCITSVDLYVRHFYEETELKIALNWIQSGDSCLDAGANLGYWSCAFANATKSHGRVISIEASPKTTNFLKIAKEFLELPQIFIESVCLSNKEDIVEFMVSEDESSSVHQSLVIDPSIVNKFYAQKIQSVTINYLVNKYAISKEISLVKIDIEGAEPLALLCGNLLFDPNALPLFIVEIYKLGLNRLGFDPKDVLSYFPCDLFELYHINRSYPNLSPEYEYGKIYPLINPETHDWNNLTNIIAVPKVGKYSHRKEKIMNYLS